MYLNICTYIYIYIYRVEAIAIRLEAITIWLDSFTTDRTCAMSFRLWHPPAGHELCRPSIGYGNRGSSCEEELKFLLLIASCYY